jgi:hypothetical protein
MNERGQTLNDYALGMGVFVLAVTITFAVIPSIFAPFTAPIESDQSVQANRVADQVLDDMTVDGTRNTIEDSKANTDFFDGSVDADDLRDRYGLSVTSQINVMIVWDDDPNDRIQMGEEYGDRPVASAVRVVVGYDNIVGNPGANCQPTCRLIVRIW